METGEPRPDEPALTQLVFNKDALISFELLKNTFIMEKLIQSSKLRSELMRTNEHVLTVNIDSNGWQIIKKASQSVS